MNRQRRRAQTKRSRGGGITQGITRSDAIFNRHSGDYWAGHGPEALPVVPALRSPDPTSLVLAKLSAGLLWLTNLSQLRQRASQISCQARKIVADSVPENIQAYPVIGVPKPVTHSPNVAPRLVRHQLGPTIAQAMAAGIVGSIPFDEEWIDGGVKRAADMKRDRLVHLVSGHSRERWMMDKSTNGEARPGEAERPQESGAASPGRGRCRDNAKPPRCCLCGL